MSKHPFLDNSNQLNKPLRKAGQIYEAITTADKLVIQIKGMIKNNAEKYCPGYHRSQRKHSVVTDKIINHLEL